MPKAIAETRVKLASGEFVSVEQGEEVPSSAPIVRECPLLFGITPDEPKKAKARKAAD